LVHPLWNLIGHLGSAARGRLSAATFGQRDVSIVVGV
jgi:hypothetical protein